MNKPTPEWEKQFDKHRLFSKKIKILDPVRGCDDPECCDPQRIINYEIKQFISKQLTAYSKEVDSDVIGEEGIDLAELPIGDNFTMGPDDALRAVKLIEPAQVIPIHYNTFDVIKQDPNAWAQRVKEETAAKVIVMKPGESLEL